ncbi:MAG: LLM class flavin-dependent oxidoreductase [Candidatus Marinimicrobia bacterium]|nr:LLM class flavin-dependent oxidoreductase [Candidatus Neomarinimicrobiota bacterium]
MKLGIALPQLGNWATPENIVTISQKAEELGYNSVWVQERLLFPLNPKKPYPVTPDGSLPEGYKYVLDPIISLSYAAANTKNIRIGTSIINVVYHTPAVLAKQLATLDHISGGRLDSGVGLGWSEDEYEATNVEFKKIEPWQVEPAWARGLRWGSELSLRLRGRLRRLCGVAGAGDAVFRTLGRLPLPVEV